MVNEEPKRQPVNLDEMDFGKLQRVGQKVYELMARKIDDPIQCYLLLKMLCFSIEDSLNFRLDAGEEEKFRIMFNKKFKPVK
jgi:hypothetical protein